MKINRSVSSNRTPSLQFCIGLEAHNSNPLQNKLIKKKKKLIGLSVLSFYRTRVTSTCARKHSSCFLLPLEISTFKVARFRRGSDSSVSDWLKEVWARKHDIHGYEEKSRHFFLQSKSSSCHKLWLLKSVESSGDITSHLKSPENNL